MESISLASFLEPATRLRNLPAQSKRLGKNVSAKELMKKIRMFLLPTLSILIASIQSVLAGSHIADIREYPNATGSSASFSPNGALDTRNPFFQSLGSNGRSCTTCHQPSQGWTITPGDLQRRFDATGGIDPIFRVNDGSVSPIADVSTISARRQAYGMLLSKGLIRVGIGIPANAEFELIAVDDPYQFASRAELSLFRRPLPSSNLRFLSAVMWDGRESAAGATLQAALIQQALDATLGHAQLAGNLTARQLEDIVDFEMGLNTAQTIDRDAGKLDTQGALGGPIHLSQQDFFIGINDPLGGNPTGAPFNPASMALFDSWTSLRASSLQNANRAAVARGERIFNSKPIDITGVAGLNDNLNLPVIRASCTLCHDTPNAGNHSVSAPLNIGISDASRRTPDLPLYTLRNKLTGEATQTTDPGRALISGKWRDIGKMKGPVLRGLASRPPYFHNGSAATLQDAVDFYETRFSIGFNAQEKADLLAFLRSL
jgi:cytochrome c peroxidase